VQHARQANVLNIGRAAGDLGGNIQPRNGLSHDLVVRCDLRPDLGGRLAFEVERGDQLAIADLAPVGGSDHAAGNRQVSRRHAEPIGGEIEQD
jgi:hypothetical protein